MATKTVQLREGVSLYAQVPGLYSLYVLSSPSLKQQPFST